MSETARTRENQASYKGQDMSHLSNGTTTNGMMAGEYVDRYEPDSVSTLAATITSIRSNVTRVLGMYFQNASDENGYGAGNVDMRQHQSANERTTTIAPLNQFPIIATKDFALTKATNSTTNAINHVVTATIETAKADELPASTATYSMPINTISTATATVTTTTTTIGSTALATVPTITHPSYGLAIKNYETCSALFANYTQPQQGIFCNWTWDTILCWPPTPAGVLARMHCPSGWHGVDSRKFAQRKCEPDGHWSGRPNETSPKIVGWTDYQSCYKPEVTQFIGIKHLEIYIEIAKRTRTLEIVGLIISLLALIISLIIFCNFRSLRNNRTKIHKNLFIAMVLQVNVRLTLYLDQAFRQKATNNKNMTGIENAPYLCEASYVLLEYARTAMFMWMFIEGLYLHNMVTVAVFQGRFPHTVFSLLGWGMPVLMTTVWALCTALYMDTARGECWWNYNLTPYYWILEGPRLVVIVLNFCFLVNIIRVLVVKLRQSQASDIEQTRKAVRAAIVLLPLLGITNLLYLVPDLQTPWNFALWSYVTHFLTSFQGFFIALIYCFLNGEVRTVLFKCVDVYMSVRGHPEWVPKRASMYSGAYNTAPDTDALPQLGDVRRASPPNRRNNGHKANSASIIVTRDAKYLHYLNDKQQPEKSQQHDDSQLQRCTHHSNNNNSTAVRSAAVVANSMSGAIAGSARNDIGSSSSSSRSNSNSNSNNNSNNNRSSSSSSSAATCHIAVTRLHNKRSATGLSIDRQADVGGKQITEPNAGSDRGSGLDNANGSGGGGGGSNWITLCFRDQKNKCVTPDKKMPQQIYTTSQPKTNNLNILKTKSLS